MKLQCSEFVMISERCVDSDLMLDVLTVDTSSLMETGYSLLMDARSAVNAKKLLASTDFQIHVQSITGFTSESLEPQAATMVILHFILFLGIGLQYVPI